MTNIGFIGLGHMGNPMARQFLTPAFNLFVYDVVPASVNKLTEAGAIGTRSIAELVDSSEVIFTSVQTGDQVRELCMGDEGIFNQMSDSQLYIDCSSIDIMTCKLLHDEAQSRGLSMLDAPVSGGVAGAEAGTLAIMVGGSAALFQKAKPYLEKIGKKIVHAGEAGHGQAAKICNNLLLAISMIGVSEAFSLAEKLGLDPKKFYEISANASGQCWSMTSYCPVPGVIPNVPSNRHYEPGFMAKMMLKDLRLGQHAAESVQATIPLGSMSAELYELFVNQGHGELDFSGIITMIAGKSQK